MALPDSTRLSSSRPASTRLSSSRDDIDELLGALEHSPPKRVSTGLKVGICCTLALSSLAAAGILAYFFCPQAHALINHVFTQLQSGQMSLWKSTLLIGLPLAGGAGVISLGIYLLRKHSNRLKNERADLIESNRPIKEFYNSVTKISPAEKRALWLGGVGLLALAAAAVGLTLLSNIPAVGHFLSHQALPLAQHKIYIWQAVAGSTAVGAGLIATVALAHRFFSERKGSIEKLSPDDPAADSDT